VKYVSAADAAAMPGLRLALTIGVPGPWSESAKKMFEYKGIPYVPVAQYMSEANEDLVAWTGIRNAPVAVWQDEPGRSNYHDIVALAERIKPDPPLLPLDPEARQTVLGISADICGETGWGWKRRIIMGRRPRDETQPSSATTLDMAVMQNAYAATEQEAELAADYLSAMLDSFAARLTQQRNEGSPYFVGNSVTACDIHWACFSAMLEPMPHEVNPMPDWLRPSYGWLGPKLEDHKHQILLDHRDHMFEKHLGLPLDY